MPDEESIIWLTTSQAMEIVTTQAPAPVTLATLINWCRVYKIGIKMGGRWYIDSAKLTKLLIKGRK